MPSECLSTASVRPASTILVSSSGGNFARRSFCHCRELRRGNACSVSYARSRYVTKALTAACCPGRLSQECRPVRHRGHGTPECLGQSAPLSPQSLPAHPCCLEHVAQRVALEPHHCVALCRAASAGPPHRASRLSCALRCRCRRVPAVAGARRRASRVADCLGRARPVQGVGAGLSKQTPADGQRGLRIFPHQVSLRLRCDRPGHMSNPTSLRTCTLPWSSPRGRYPSSIVGWSEWTLVV